MTENDRKAKTVDCSFLLLAKLPSGDIHVVNVRNQELKDFLNHRKVFQVLDNKIKGLTFEIVL